MKTGAAVFFLWLYVSQPGWAQSTLFETLSTGDSLVYYQCHVEEAVQQLRTASGQTLTGSAQPYTITEKYVVKKQAGSYTVTYFTSALGIFPNRKFSGLKLREKKYWAFKNETTFALTERQQRAFVAIEKAGRAATEYDYPVTKYTTNQLIVKQRKHFRQLVLQEGYLLSKLLDVNARQ